MLRLKHVFPSLATPGDITRNIVSETMFPSLARPLRRSLVDHVKKMHESACRTCSTIFSLVQPIRSLICDVVVDDAATVS